MCSDIGAVRIIDETSVQVTTQFREIKWEKYGLKLNIWRPDNIQTCTITIKASFSGQYDFRGRHLVSPVFWMKCEPHCNFTHPMRLEIKHCAERDACLSMATALCRESPFYFDEVQDKGNFLETGWGVMKMKTLGGFYHGICVVQSGNLKRRYWSNLFCTGSALSRDFYVAVTWDDRAHITVSALATIFAFDLYL